MAAGINGWPRDAVTSEIPGVEPGHFNPRPNPALYRNAEQVKAALGTDIRLLDLRYPNGFFMGNHRVPNVQVIFLALPISLAMDC